MALFCAGGGWKLIKSTLCAASLAAVLCINTPAFAEIPLPQDSKTDNHAYTLTKVDQLGENTITKYEWSEEQNKLVPVYYRVDLTKTEYGEGDGVLYFKWDKTEGELFETKEPSEAQIIARYDTSKLYRSNVINSDCTNTDVYNGGAFVREGNGALEVGKFGKLGDIKADFIYNQGVEYSGHGAGIINEGEIGNITGNFIGNYNAGYLASGAAILNEGIIGDINGDFVGNWARASNDSIISGGAIYNSGGIIGNITGNFIGNFLTPGKDNIRLEGGAINNSGGTIGDITGDFIGNYASSYSSYSASGSSGGAINNGGVINGDITGDFIGNYASSSSSSQGGAICNAGIIGNITGDFIGNYTSSTDGFSLGGAIANMGVIGTIDISSQTITYDGEIKNSSFINNYAESTNGQAYGGAILSMSQLNITADDGLSIFSGNKTISNDSEEQNAIAMYAFAEKNADSGKIVFINPITYESSETNPAKLTLNAKNNGIIQFDDTIRGGAILPDNLTTIETPETAYDLNITGDESGKIILNNSVINANISLDNTNLFLGKEDVFNQSQSLTLNSGSLFLNNNTVGTMHVPTLNLNGTTNLSVDVDLANKSMDRITANNYNIQDNAKLNVNNILLLNDANQDKTDIFFADKEYAQNVAYTGANPIAYSPIYKYEVSYNPDEGFFSFNRGGFSDNTGNPSDNYNPSVLAPSVATQAGAYTTQLQTFNYAFQHSDNFMNIPYLERLSIKNQNKYALSPTADATDVGTFSPLLTKHYHNGFWFKPYASFENIPLKNGPKVSNINYGTLVGYDSEMKTLPHGIDRVLTAYIGYNGASQRYSGVDAYQNGGLIGGTATFYKGNFFNATTLSVGATAGDASTMYGKENYTMLLAGIGNKTGYNFEFFKGKAILQPSMLISYTFVNTFDYTNSAGLRIKSDPLNAIQLAPGIKLIGNTKTGWQPYASVAMVWNLLDDSKVTANDTRLPEMSIKPYVQYGLGVQKCFKEDKMTAFGQAMIHNGGRNGISLTAGLRWKVGRD